jgi:hypothetical protein
MSDIRKVVLAYSGGLDTSVILVWLRDTYGCEVVTFTADLGQDEEIEPAREKAKQLGVREITVRYELQGRDEVLKLAEDYTYLLEQNTPSTRSALSRLDIKVPARAGRCWTTPAQSQAPLTLPRFIQEQAEKKVNPPPKPPEPPLPPIKPLKPVPTREIEVAEGDTLFSIGRRYKVDPMILRSLNGLKTDKILSGQKLLVPIWPEAAN